MWCLSIDMKHKLIGGIYTAIYHSPNSSHAKFIQILSEISDKIFDPSNRNIWIGDFNIDLNRSNDTYTKKLLRLISASGMKQSIHEPTRVTEQSKTLIDLVISNDYNISCKVLNEHRISDHETIEVRICNSSEMEARKDLITVKCWEKYSKEEIERILSGSDWSEWYQLNVAEKTTYLESKLKNAVKELVYEKTVQIRNINRWYDKELIDLNKDKIKAFKSAEQTNDYSEYKEIKKEYKKLIRLKKKTYIQNKMNSAKGDQARMWKCLKDITSNKNKIKKLNEIEIEGEKYTDPEIIVRKLNTYFIETIKSLANSIDTTIGDSELLINCITYNPNELEFGMITLEELRKVVELLKNKGSKNDLLNTQVIRDSFEQMEYFYMALINESLETGEIAQEWKNSTVIPIPKSAGPMNADNLRPINKLANTEKVLESCVKVQLLKFIEANRILVEEQSGYRHRHSCETALNLVIANWKEDFQRGKYIHSVFIDLKKAFETVDRDILLRKLERYGIRGKSSRWFRSYLDGRQQFTEMSGVKSRAADNNIGVPQGSILGPILFIIYINDIVKCLKYCKIHLFADDALITISNSDPSEAISRLNHELARIAEWLEANKLVLTVSKTKYMCMGSKSGKTDSKVKIKSVEIEEVSTM